MRIYSGILFLGIICMRVYRGIFSLGTNLAILHAYLPRYVFPGEYFACVFTVVSFPRGLICMRIYRGIFSLGTYFACVFTVVSFPWGLICMRVYHAILSLGTIILYVYTYLRSTASAADLQLSIVGRRNHQGVVSVSVGLSGLSFFCMFLSMHVHMNII